MKRIWLAAAAALMLCGGGLAPRAAAAPLSQPSPTLKVLNLDDVRAYAAAFTAIRRGEFEAADLAIEGIRDPCLMGRLTYEKLMHPAYSAAFPELKAWLDKYRDQPDADRVWTLAHRRRTIVEADPPAPEGPTADAAAVGAMARTERMAVRFDAPPKPNPKISPRLMAAREAYYGGEVTRAYKLAKASGERWIMGLTAYRTHRYAEALQAFSALSHDRAQNEWVRSAGAYWAARSAIAAGEAQKAPALLQLAAQTPYTFYGLIAERQLGLDPAVGPAGLTLPSADTATAAPEAAVSTSALSHLVHADPRARRATAFAQIGLRAEAGLELRAALLAAGKDEDRRRWAGLAVALNAPLSSPADISRGRQAFDIAAFPTPDLQPNGGFTLNKALVYALVKQESRFNPEAASTAGAYGLMQLTPATAAHVARDDSLARDPTPLKDPAVNLRLGQDYVAALLGAVKGDLLHAVAAYNIGPGVVTRTAAQMQGADSLLVLESLPGGQTREFVQRVVANYWIYRRVMGQSVPSLDAAASAAQAVKALVDPG